jgi:hypothetical protein
MRGWPVAAAVSIVTQTVCSQPADVFTSRLKACFQLERALQAECLENLSRELDDKNNRNPAEPAAPSWIVSETTSPVDYSPVITATTSSHQPVAKDAPAIFMIRCRGQRTDVLVSTEGSWRGSRANELQVDLRSTTNLRSGCSGVHPRTDGLPFSRTTQSDFYDRYLMEDGL